LSIIWALFVRIISSWALHSLKIILVAIILRH
jgi:hypothetical protein